MMLYQFLPKQSFIFAIVFLFSLSVYAQQKDSKSAPVIVQPGAPGQTTRVLPSTTKAKLPPDSRKDVEFMQGMIHHHGQAVDMTALIESRTENKEVGRLGARISQSQSDEINFMKRWLEVRREITTMEMSDDMNMSGHHHEMLMPGMLSKKQMEALKNAKGVSFDKLFLQGMVQHHKGALVMVEELFKTAGAGQDAELFNFATDVDSGQRAEIRIMQTLLGK